VFDFKINNSLTLTVKVIVFKQNRITETTTKNPKKKNNWCQLPKRRFLMLAPYVWFPIHISSTRSPLKSTRRFKCLTHYTQHTTNTSYITPQSKQEMLLNCALFLLRRIYIRSYFFPYFFLFIRNREKKESKHTKWPFLMRAHRGFDTRVF